MTFPHFLINEEIGCAELDKGSSVSLRLIEQLTPRELEILGLLCDGHSNDEISIQLDIRLPTVKYHVNHIFEKLHVRRRTQAVAVAVYLQLVKPNWLKTNAWYGRKHLLVRPNSFSGLI